VGIPEKLEGCILIMTTRSKTVADYDNLIKNSLSSDGLLAQNQSEATL